MGANAPVPIHSVSGVQEFVYSLKTEPAELHHRIGPLVTWLNEASLEDWAEFCRVISPAIWKQYKDIYPVAVAYRKHKDAVLSMVRNFSDLEIEACK